MSEVFITEQLRRDLTEIRKMAAPSPEQCAEIFSDACAAVERVRRVADACCQIDPDVAERLIR